MTLFLWTVLISNLTTVAIQIVAQAPTLREIMGLLRCEVRNWRDNREADRPSHPATKKEAR